MKRIIIRGAKNACACTEAFLRRQPGQYYAACGGQCRRHGRRALPCGMIPVILLIATLLLMTACTVPVVAEPEIEPSPIKTAEPTATPEPLPTAPPGGAMIGISVMAGSTAFDSAVKWQAERLAQTLNCEYRLFEAVDDAEQSYQIEKLVSLGCEIIIAYPGVADLSLPAKKALDNGVKLICFERGVGDITPNYIVRNENTNMGIAAANYIAQTLEGKGNIGIVYDNTDKISLTRKRAFDTLILSYNERLSVVFNGRTRSSSEKAITNTINNMLNRNKKIHAIYATNDQIATIALKVIASRKRTDVQVVVGGGGASEFFATMEKYPNIKVATQIYSPYAISRCFEIAAALINSSEEKTFEPVEVLKAETVDLSTLAEYRKKWAIDETSPY